MDDFFKNLKQKLSFENAHECLTDDRDFDVAISREEKESVREDVITNASTDQEDKPCYGVLHKQNEPTVLSNQSGMKTIDDSSISNSANTSDQKAEETILPEKKKSNPVMDGSILF